MENKMIDKIPKYHNIDLKECDVKVQDGSPEIYIY